MSGAKQNNEQEISLGNWLKNAREQKGESLDNVSAVTRIGKNYLQSIEDDQLEKLPSQAYIKGFIRLYARHLGLSDEEAFLLLDRGLRSNTEYSENCKPSIMPEVRSGSGAGSSALRKWAISLLLLLGVSLFAVLPALKQSKNRAPGPDRVTTNPLTSPTGLPAATAVSEQAHPDPKLPDTTAEKPLPPPATAPGIILRLKAVQDGRVHITIDNAISQEYELKSGDVIEWKAETVFLVELDNAGSVEGELNGTRMKAFGDPGKAAHLTIRADTIR